MSNAKNANSATGVYIGIVKRTADPAKAGRLSVWIPEFSASESDEESWKTVDYCSPFAGVTDYKNMTGNTQEYAGTQQSYGFWMVPPDIGTQVLVMFANGKPDRGFWIGCLFGRYMNQMVPCIASGKNYKDGGKNLPVAEYNKYERVPPSPVHEDSTVRPYHRDKTEAISNQGLINDKIRGTTTSSARRESPSQVFGISTPGPLNGKTRMGGSSFVMDDNKEEEYIAFRTRSGAQIRLDETNGLVYIINKKGTGWVQIDEDGNIDLFGAGSISMRAQQDINLRADRHINIEAGQNINIKAAKDTDSSSLIVGEGNGLGGDIVIQAINNEQHIVKKDLFLTVLEGNANIAVTSGNLVVSAGGTIGLKSSNANLTSGGDMTVTGTMYADDFRTPSVGLNGHKHKYNPGGGAPTPSQASESGGGSGGSGPSADPAKPKPMVDKKNVKADFEDPETKYTRKTEDIKTTVDRFLTFEPCPEHKQKGE